MTHTRRDGGFGFPLGFAAAVTATVVSVAAGATVHHAYSLGALIVVTAGVALVTPMRVALGVAAVAWALHAGFVLGRLGELVFTPESVRAATVLVAVAVVGSFAQPRERKVVRVAAPEESASVADGTITSSSTPASAYALTRASKP